MRDDVTPSGPGRAPGSREPTPPPSWWPPVAVFAELSQELLAVRDEPALYELMCRRVGSVVPAAEFCGVTMRRRRGRLESVQVTDPLAEQADLLQYELGEGPCMEAAHDAHSFLSEDLAGDPRWPSWGPRAAELGIRSLVSVRLPSDTMHERHEPLGALNLYAGRPGALGPDELRLAQAFARHAANALAAVRQTRGLEQAVAARHLVGAAQGVLRARYDLDLETAFEVLSRLSNQRNTKLRDLAAQVVAEGALPGGDEAASSFAPGDDGGRAAPPGPPPPRPTGTDRLDPV